MESQSESIRSSLQRISIGSYIFQSEIADAFGLHARDLHAISCLSLRGTLAAGELSSMLDLTSGATTTLINRLISSGFARRRADPEDRRKVLVELAGPRLRRLRARYREIESRIEGALAGLSSSETAAVARFLAALAELQPSPGYRK